MKKRKTKNYKASEECRCLCSGHHGLQWSTKHDKVEEPLCLFPSDCASFLLFATPSASTREVRGLRWNKITQIPSPRLFLALFFSSPGRHKAAFLGFYRKRNLQLKQLLCWQSKQDSWLLLNITQIMNSNNKCVIDSKIWNYYYADSM